MSWIDLYERDEKPIPPRAWWEWVAIIFLVGVVVFASLMFLATPVRGQPVVVAAQHFRDTLNLSDPDRDWNCVWTRADYTRPTAFGFFNSGDDIWQPVTLLDSTGRAFPVAPYVIREQDWYENCFYRTFRVPQSTPNGNYTIRLNNQNVGTLSVSRRIQQFGTIGAFGKFACYPGTTYRSYGTTIVNGDIQLAPGVSLVGMTFYDSIIQGPFTNGLIKDCRFIRCQLGGMVDWSKPKEYADHGALYQDCHFDRTKVTGCCSGAFINCQWTGLVLGSERIGHNFVCERAKRLCMLNCTFDGTDRGPILRTGWGDSSDNLYAGFSLRNINQVPNGGELFCIEGHLNRFDRNLIFGVNSSNCVNHLQIFNTRADGNLIANSRFGSNTTINFSGLESQNWNQARYNKLSTAILVNRDGNKAVNTVLLDNVLTERTQP